MTRYRQRRVVGPAGPLWNRPLHRVRDAITRAWDAFMSASVEDLDRATARLCKWAIIFAVAVFGAALFDWLVRPWS